MPLIDFRCRPNTPEYMSVGAGPEPEMNRLKWQRWNFEEPAPVSLDKFIAAMDAHGVDIGVFTGRQVRATGDAEGFGLSNEYIHECIEAYPARLVGFAGVDIAGGKESAAELRRTVTEYGFKGAALDPRMANTYPADRVAYPIYEAARELRVPVVFTMGPFVAGFLDPTRFDQVAADFPDVNFVCSHAPWPHVVEYLGLAYRRPNIYLEPSIYWTLPGNDPLFEAANGFLSEQVIYGSGHPFHPLGAAEAFKRRIDWSPEAWNRVSYANAARLLRL